MMNKTIIVWIRKDFRLVDNPALFHAAKEGMVVPVYIYGDYEESSMGSASKWWLHHALNDFKTSIEKIEGKLIVQKGILKMFYKNYSMKRMRKTFIGTDAMNHMR
jgi:deoxyribodipyrimidine photo-lyase